MSEYLAPAAAKLGVSEPIVKRSAEARAKATGVSVDEILKAWAGGAAAPPAAQPTSDPRPATPAEPATSLAGDGSRESESALAGFGSRASDSALAGVGSRESVGVRAGSQLEARSPMLSLAPPREVSPKEALRFPAVVTVPTAGLAERTVSSVPRWLATFFVIIPIFGLLQLAGATSNDCGQGGELAVDRVSGKLVNCDGTPFTGRGEPGGATDFVALGEQIFRGVIVSTVNCQGCHGAQGQGGVGPALGTVASTFSSCVDHIEWVTKGTLGFQGEGRATYGDLNKPVGGVGTMPPFGRALTAEQIAAVVSFERVRFGGLESGAVLTDCGLATPAAGEGGAGTEGTGGTTAPANGAATTAP